MMEPPAHLQEHPSCIQLSPEQLLDAQPRHWRMTLDEEIVVCPGCQQSLYESKIPQHAKKCRPLAESRP